MTRDKDDPRLLKPAFKFPGDRNTREEMSPCTPTRYDGPESTHPFMPYEVAVKDERPTLNTES
jgi:hypothetical protein